MSGISCAAPIAAAYAAMILGFVERLNGDAKLTETKQKSFSKEENMFKNIYVMKSVFCTCMVEHNKLTRKLGE